MYIQPLVDCPEIGCLVEVYSMFYIADTAFWLSGADIFGYNDSLKWTFIRSIAITLHYNVYVERLQERGSNEFRISGRSNYTVVYPLCDLYPQARNKLPQNYSRYILISVCLYQKPLENKGIFERNVDFGLAKHGARTNKDAVYRVQVLNLAT